VITLGSHQKYAGESQTHITPREIIEALGPFDLDPAAADPRPWDCAAASFTEADNGLTQPWFGRVWLNPPFDQRVVPSFVRRLVRHGRGTCLLHARTETAWFAPIWESATAILFLAHRLHFHQPDGTRWPANSGAPVVLIAFGDDDAERLRISGIPGAFVPRKWTRRPAKAKGRQADLFDGGYDAAADFAKSLDEGYRVIRERIAVGGKGWTPR
jgi:hypothetical protein